MVTFLNAILAFGGLAFTIPLAIHLLFRSRYRVVSWGAMHLLERFETSNSRSFQWRDWLLLLCRCLIPVFLALAMARPLASSMLASSDSDSLAVVIILDNSPSMLTEMTPGKTRWEVALDHVLKISNTQVTDQRLAIVLAGETPQLVDQSLPSRMDQWRAQPPPGGSLQALESTNLAIQWLDRHSSLQRRIVWISDFQANDWRSSSESFQAMCRAVTQPLLPPQVAWLNILPSAPQEVPPTNLAIEELSTSPQRFVEEQEVRLTAKIKNHSPRDRTKLKLRFEADLRTIEVQEFDLAAGATTTVATRWKSPSLDDSTTRKTVRLHARLLDSDALFLDNEVTREIVVNGVRRVLLVDGARSPESMKSETDFLRIALAPFASANVSQPDPFRCRVVDRESWERWELDKVDVVALCNVGPLPEEPARRLEEFADGGGGVIIFAGDKSSSKPIIGPVAMGDRIAGEGSRQPLRIDTERMGPGILSELSSASRESLRSVDILNDSTLRWENSASVEVQEKLSDGRPWIARSGNILYVSTSCDTDDSDLPKRPVYVPLMQSLFHRVAQPQDLTLRSGTTYARSGYESISVSAAESSLLAISESERSTCRDQMRATIFDAPEKIFRASGQLSLGRELWRWAWLLAVICFLSEMALTQSYGRRRQRT
jgi:hypothetical protein